MILKEFSYVGIILKVAKCAFYGGFSRHFKFLVRKCRRHYYDFSIVVRLINGLANQQLYETFSKELKML